MNKITVFLFLLLTLLTSCYKETNPFPYEQYLGNWHNDLTLVNGVRDNFHPYNTVPHYSFGIAQSELTLSSETNIGTQYQNWRVDNTTTPSTLLLWVTDIKTKPDVTFVITKEPYFDIHNGGTKMEITYQDSIVYQLSK